MKHKVLLGALLLSCSSALFAMESIIGSGQLATDFRAVDDVHVIDFTGIGNLSIERSSGEEGLWIEAEENLLPYLLSETRNGVLHIWTEPNTDVHAILPINLTVKLPALERVHLRGSTVLETQTPYKTSHLRIEVEDAASANVEIEADELDLDIRGAGSINAVGKVSKQKIKASDKAKYSGANLVSKKTSISGTGDAKLDLTADEDLSVYLSENASLDYHGSPKVTQQLSGQATVKSS